MIEWINKWQNELMNEWIIGIKNEFKNIKRDEGMQEWMKERMKLKLNEK